MMSAHPATGYGPSNNAQGRYSRLFFDGDERKYEQWEVKFLAYMLLQKLKSVILTPEGEEIDRDKNELAYAELIQFLDEKSLSLVMRDAADDGRKALSILRAHYAGSGTPRIIALYTELTSLTKQRDESVTDYVIRAETAATALKSAGETVNDSLLIAMVLKGLPESYKSFVVVVTQSKTKQTFSEFKVALRSFEDTESARTVHEDSVMKMNMNKPRNSVRKDRKDIKCFICAGNHYARDCQQPRKKQLWCNHCQSTSHTDQACRSRKRQKEVKERARGDQMNTMSDQTENDEHQFMFKVKSGENSTSQRNSILVDCGATAHIITDENKFVQYDRTFNADKHFVELADGTRANNVAVKRGDACMTLLDESGDRINITLCDALLVPSYPHDIFSVQAATEKGAKVTFTPSAAKLQKNGRTFNIHKRGRLYYLNYEETHSDENDVLCATKSIEEWHEILGHCNYRDIIKLEDKVEGMKLSGGENVKHECEVCIMGKMVNEKSRKARVKSEAPLELVHTDLAGPIEPTSREGFKYAISFTDDYSGVVFLYFLKSKSDTVIATEKFLADSAPHGKVKSMKSDNGTEFTSHAFRSLLRQNQIRHITSAPYSPHQNGTAERYWRTLFEMGRCLLLQSKLKKELWPYAVMAAAYIRNRCYSERLGQTPYYTFSGRKPNISNMQVFGSVCYAYEQKKGKLDSRCTKGIFVGYDKGSPAYLVYFPETDKVMRHRVVKFSKNLPTESQVNSDIAFDDEFVINNEPCRPETPNLIHPIPDTGTHTPSSSHSETSAVAFETRKNPIRERKVPTYLSDYVSGIKTDDKVMSNIEYCYRVAVCPQTYEEAMQSPDSEKWKNAMKDEMQSLKDNDTFTLTPLPPGRTPVGGRWVYTVKDNADFSLTYKARYVAKGYSQIKGIDYQETFSPTANLTSIRGLMQFAAQNDLILHQMDVKTAYLNAPIDCEIYMEQPEGFEVPSSDGNKLVCKLNKSLYGLKQSGRNWNNLLHYYLLENDFVQNESDHCVYSKYASKNEMMIVIVWVDDLMLAASNETLMHDMKQVFVNKFKMKDLGRLSYFLGIEFEQNENSVTMSQKRYISKVLERFEMTDCKPKSTPSEQKLECNDTSPADSKTYREAVGSLIYSNEKETHNFISLDFV